MKYCVPIGKPIANIQVYVLDEYLQPLPIGVTGELYIGGDALARGYLNRPELTAEKFIENPFGEGKLYKTGDLVHSLPDGTIEFIGRIDNQVKIRGFRIELGEIEANINQHPHIQETLVIAKENKEGDKYLIAYIIANNNIEIKDLTQFLSIKLPEYMIPSAFVFLDQFPLTSNGKIDPKALPEADFEANREQEFIAPRNETEIKLAQIWQEVLGIEEVGINDNFFALGGHSLLATQVMSRINNALALNLSLIYLFESPTIRKLGERLAIILSDQSPQELEFDEGQL